MSVRDLVGGTGPTLSQVPIGAIRPSPYQPRQVVDEAELEELVASIRWHGVLQPILLRSRGDSFELVAGERRWRACLRLEMDVIPAIVRDMDDEEAAVFALVENLQRSDLDFMEEAEGIQRLVANFSLTQGEVARRLGKSQSAVANKLRLLRLPAQIRDGLRLAGVSERHARALLRLDGPEEQEAILAEVRSGNLTVKETELLVEERRKRNSRNLAPKGKRVGIYKDLRIFLNGFREAVSTLVRAGVQASISEFDRGDYLEVSVRIPKDKRGGE